MKIFYLLLLLFFLGSASCKKQKANGQFGSISDTKKSTETNASFNVSGNVNSKQIGSDIMADSDLARETNIRTNLNDENMPFVRTPVKPVRKLVKLKETPVNKDLTAEEWISVDWKRIDEILGNGNICKSADGAIYNIKNQTYILELACEGNINSGGYIYYFVNEKAMSAELVSFERFEQNERTKQIEEHIFNYMIGESGFDEDTKTMHFRELYYAGGQCGWEGVYKFINGESKLINFRAEWNCEKDGSFDDWKEMNLQKLRQTSKKTIYDKFKD